MDLRPYLWDSGRDVPTRVRAGTGQKWKMEGWTRPWCSSLAQVQTGHCKPPLLIVYWSSFFFEIRPSAIAQVTSRLEVSLISPGYDPGVLNFQGIYQDGS